MTALGSDDTQIRIQALIKIKHEGTTVLPVLLEILRRPDATVASLVWTMIGIGQLGPVAAPPAHAALVHCLGATSPTVRRAAMRTLQELRDVDAVRHIAVLRTDHTKDPSAWFDDDCTVSQTAEMVLAELSKPTS